MVTCIGERDSVQPSRQGTWPALWPDSEDSFPRAAASPEICLASVSEESPGRTPARRQGWGRLCSRDGRPRPPLGCEAGGAPELTAAQAHVLQGGGLESWRQESHAPTGHSCGQLPSRSPCPGLQHSGSGRGGTEHPRGSPAIRAGEPLLN